MQVPVAVRGRHKRRPSYPHDCRTSERVSKTDSKGSLSPSVCGFTFRYTLPLHLFTSMLTQRCFRKDNIVWECENGGQLWTDSVTSGYDNGASFPSGFCASGFSSIYAAFIGGLLVDLVFQVSIFGEEKLRTTLKYYNLFSLNRCTCYS